MLKTTIRLQGDYFSQPSNYNRTILRLQCSLASFSLLSFFFFHLISSYTICIDLLLTEKSYVSLDECQRQVVYNFYRFVLAGAGGVDHNQLVQLAEKHFSSVNTKIEGEIPLLTPCRYTGSEVRVRDDSIPLAHIAVAVEGIETRFICVY